MPFKFNPFTGKLDFVNEPLSSPVAVDEGGTGAASFTAYSVICGGTTGTGALQNVSGVGSSGQVLTSQGAGSLPQWTTVAGSGDVTKVGTPVDNQIGVWTGDGTIEGDTALTFDTSTDTLAVAASGKLNFGAVTILSDSAGTMTLSNVDALDATTEATIESAIDTLANLTSAAALATIGTVTTGVWNGTAVGVAYGGTGQTTYTDGQLLIGNSTGNTLAKATLTGTANEIDVTNGSGTITLDLSDTIDLGGKTSLEIPNSATPTVNADGEIALDTTVTDWSHGILKYYGGEEMAVVAMPVAQLTSPTDNHVVTYNATNDEFELQPGGGGSMPDAVYQWKAAALDVDESAFAPLEQITTTNIIQKVRAFDYATVEYVNTSFVVPADFNASGTNTFSVEWFARTVPSPSENVVWQVEHAAVADGEDLDSATYTAIVATADATGTTQNALVRTTWTEANSTTGWVAGDTVYLRFSRKSTDANDTFDSVGTTSDDALMVSASVAVGQA